METIQCIKERRSIRKFQDRKVPHEVINEIIEAAAYCLLYTYTSPRDKRQ